MVLPLPPLSSASLPIRPNPSPLPTDLGGGLPVSGVQRRKTTANSRPGSVQRRAISKPPLRASVEMSASSYL